MGEIASPRRSFVTKYAISGISHFHLSTPNCPHIGGNGREATDRGELKHLAERTETNMSKNNRKSKIGIKAIHNHVIEVNGEKNNIECCVNNFLVYVISTLSFY